MNRAPLLLAIATLLACGNAKTDKNKQAAATTESDRPAADTAKPTSVKRGPLSEEARARYRAALSAGRRDGKAGNWPAAVKLFEEALEAAPSDPRALSELGWAAFNAKDYGKAHRATLESLAGTPAPKLRAASLYNLGRVHEAREETDRAVAAYQRSLELRPNKTVQERLTKIAPTVVPAAPFAATALAGPYPSVEAFCVELSKTDEELCDPAGDSAFDQLASGTPAGAPVRSISVFRSGWDEHCSLAIRTARGWFVEPQFADCKEIGGPWDRTVDVRRLEYKDLTGDSKAELIVEYDSEFVRSSPDHETESSLLWTRSERFLQVCGVGESNTPSCMAPVIVKLDIHMSNADGGDVETQVSFELSAHFSRGNLEIGLKSGELDKDEAPTLGRHPLRFP